MTSFSIRFQRMAGSLRAMASSALALGALSASVVLSGEEAKALRCTFVLDGNGLTSCEYGLQWNGAPGNPIPPGPPQTPITNDVYDQVLQTNIGVNNVLYYYPTDKEILFDDGPSGNGGVFPGFAGNGLVFWDWEDNNNNGTFSAPADANVDAWAVSVDYSVLDGTVVSTSAFQYYLGIKDSYPDQWFSKVQLFSPSPMQYPQFAGMSVKKSIYSVLNTFPDTLLGTITGSGSLTLPANTYKDLFILDELTTNGTVVSDYAYVNAFYQTPGPLPVLGVGAAFGFSRKLRQRIKASRAA